MYFTYEMKVFIKIVFESARQAWQALISNKLRTFLSLLGILIGIFCIISVLSAVNSLERSIKSGIGELGSDVIMVDVFPWNEDPGMNYWKYMKRPTPSHDDYEYLKTAPNNFENAAFAVYSEGKTIKYRSSNVEGAVVMGATYEYPDVQKMEIAEGRYFTEKEYSSGANKVIMGDKIAAELFPNENPLDKYVRMYGNKFQVIGVLEEEGDNPFNFMRNDELIWISYNTAKKYINVKSKNRFSVGKILYVKMGEEADLVEAKEELIGSMRRARKLRPKDADNFSLNEVTMLTNMIDSVFGVVYIAGFIIGFFALLVGMFSVANIMFVSVQERTNIIGIKKALGAKKGIILTEFLIESVILCILGGTAGLLLVVAVLKIATALLKFDISASPLYIMIGIGVSVLVGILAGIIPAFRAANLDPVEAIRK